MKLHIEDVSHSPVVLQTLVDAMLVPKDVTDKWFTCFIDIIYQTSYPFQLGLVCCIIAEPHCHVGVDLAIL